MSSEPLTIALESSVRPTSLAVRRGADLLELVLDGDRAHASDLVQRLQALLVEFDAQPADLSLIVVGLGPGSYTGLRVGVATALGLAYGSGADLVGVPSFEAQAFGALQPGERADVLLDARGGHLYHARYRRCASGVEVESQPRALPTDKVQDALEAEILLADDAALLAADAPGELRDRQRAGTRPLARDLATLGLARVATSGPTAPDALSPLYLRTFEPHVRTR